MSLLRSKKLFNVRLQHNFYVDGITRDFNILPTPETAQILRNNKLTFKHDQTGFRVFYRTEENTDMPFVNFENIELRFILQLKNVNEFLNFTNLGLPAKIFNAGNLAWFTNDGDVTQPALDYGIIDQLKSKEFTYVFPQTGTELTGSIQIKNEQGVDVTPVYPNPNAVPKTSSNNYLYPIDFSGMPNGRYEFITTVGASVITQYLYLDDSLTLSGAFGIIKILVEDYEAFPMSPDPQREYAANFVRRETIWKYIFVLKSGAVDIGDDLSLDDSLSPVAPYDNYIFSRLSDTTVNGIPAAVFESGATPKIPFYEIPKTGLKLVKVTAGPVETDILDNVTNPQRNIVSFTMNGGVIEKSIIYVYV